VPGGKRVRCQRRLLIARVNGLMDLGEIGPTGRVHKKFLNQEVLRLPIMNRWCGYAGPIEREGRPMQRQGAHDRRTPVPALFLDCKPAAAGVAAVLGMVKAVRKGFPTHAMPIFCSVNEDAVRAANAVGLIEESCPRQRSSLEPEANRANNGAP